MHLNDYALDLRLGRIRARARINMQRPSKVVSNRAADPHVTRESRDDSSDHAGAERRRSGRTSLDTDIVVRRVGGFNFEVGVQDISRGGCRVELIEAYEVGDPVITRLPNLEPLGSRVCWTEGTTAGIQFLRPIHPAVLDSLVQRLGEQSPAN